MYGKLLLNVTHFVEHLFFFNYLVIFILVNNLESYGYLRFYGWVFVEVNVIVLIL